MIGSPAIAEIEQFEGDDTLHDFAGPHSGKGADFPSYWVMLRLVELEQADAGDYLFVCEYMQDVAEFDSSSAPASVWLYQLKKKEDGYWRTSKLTGQTSKSKVPVADSPLMKLIGHVRSFKRIQAKGAFVSNSKFDVHLASGQSSVNDEAVGLHLLHAAHCSGLKAAIAAAEGCQETDIDLQTVELRYTNLALDDMERHLVGVMFDFIQQVAPDHVQQAQSLVQALFSQIKARSRRTSKAANWAELVAKRGFGKATFQEALEALTGVRDKASARARLFTKLSSAAGWTFYEAGFIEVGLAQCAREKVLVGEGCRWTINRAALCEVCEDAAAKGLSDLEFFEAVCVFLYEAVPALRLPEIKALAIYEMVEWNLNPTRA
jgi:hypothetical protein